MFPTISVIIPTYNRAHFISETLNSIIAQTYQNWECLIIDDGGTDNTLEVITPFLEKDKRFQYLKRPEKYLKGASGCRNHGLDIAKGDYIQFCDDDDLLHPMKLKLQLEPLFKNEELNFTICKYHKLIKENNGNFKTQSPEFELLASHLGDAILVGDLKINTVSSLWRKKIISQFRFDETLNHAEEWELFTRIGYHYPSNYGVVDEYLFKYRKHQNSLTLGDDIDYEKRKTSAIIRIKILDYLTDHKLHTKISILFLAKTFLITFYNPIYVKQLINYVKLNNSFSFKLSWFLKLGLVFAKFYSKFIGKLASWV